MPKDVLQPVRLRRRTIDGDHQVWVGSYTGQVGLRVECVADRTLYGGLGHEIHRLRMGPQESFHPAAQLGVAAAGVVQIIGSLRGRVLAQRGEKDRFDPRRSAHHIAPIPKGLVLNATPRTGFARFYS